MGIYVSKLWFSDLDEIVDVYTEIENLAGKCVMITGCNGLICSAVTDVLIRWNLTHEKKINIIAAGRNEKKIKERFFPFSQKEWFAFVPYDASSKDNSINLPCDYIIHGASNAYPEKIIREPVETILSNVVGLKYLLDYAKKNHVNRLLLISSSEVYGKKYQDTPRKTNEYGQINILNPRNSYSIGKCAAETMCASYYEEYGVESVIIRPGHIYGPTAGLKDNRVSSSWAYDAARGIDIIMKSEGSQIRSYCYCLDCASAILTVLLKGQNIHAYNISNPGSINKLPNPTYFIPIV